MADVIRLNQRVLAESRTDDQGVTLGERIRALVSTFAAEWVEARKMDPDVCKVKIEIAREWDLGFPRNDC